MPDPTSSTRPLDGRVPFRDPTRQFAWAERALEELPQELRSGAFHGIDRRTTVTLQEGWAAFCGTGAAEATSSGTSALVIGLLALGAGPGVKVFTTPNTFAATIEAIRLAGAEPVLVDIDRDSYTMDAEALARTRPRAGGIALPFHAGGRVAAMDRLREVCVEHGLQLMEEACQAAGAAYKGVRAGALGDLAAFSFGQSKPLATLGEGGCVTTSDPTLADRLVRLNRHGQASPHAHSLIGGNFRISPLEAALLLRRLPQYRQWHDRRQAIADRYTAALEPFGVVRNPIVEPGSQHGWYVYMIEVEDRADFIRFLDHAGVGWGIHYPTLIHMQPHQSGLGEAGAFPRAEEVNRVSISLPLFPELTDAEVERVIEVAADFLTVRGRVAAE